MKDAIAISLHTAFNHLGQPGSYVRMLFINYSSAFNTIVLVILVNKLADFDHFFFINGVCVQGLSFFQFLDTTYNRWTGLLTQLQW